MKGKQMSKYESIKIDDIEYVRADREIVIAGPIKIAVLDRGFVYVGRIDTSDKEMMLITNAKNIRQLGTAKGLGELINGPLSKTILDTVGTVRIPYRAIISLIDVNQELWK
jgi:hypothetical protein